MGLFRGLGDVAERRSGSLIRSDNKQVRLLPSPPREVDSEPALLPCPISEKKFYARLIKILKKNQDATFQEAMEQVRDKYKVYHDFIIPWYVRLVYTSFDLYQIGPEHLDREKQIRVVEHRKKAQK